MTPEDWGKAKHIVAEALGLPPEARMAFLVRACDGDDALRAEAESLIRYAADKTAPTAGLPLTDLSPGQLIAGRYQIRQRLGEGGFATTYLASDQQLHERPVVIKVLSAERAREPWVASKFEDEGRALCAIDHPNVVAPLGTGRLDDARPYLVMEYIRGRTLRAVLPEIEQSRERIAAILRQIGSALEAVHARNIYHRDLKPENIMIETLQNGADHVRLIDFGIATVAGEGGPTMVQTMAAGSLRYMAPEQFEGCAGRYSDIYALAVIAWEMFTGSRPFAGDDPAEIQKLQRAGSAALLADERGRDLPVHLKQLLLAGLAFDPYQRPGETGAYVKALAAAAVPDLSLPRSHWPRTAILAVATLVLVMAIVGAVYSWQTPAARMQTAQSPGPARIGAALIVRKANSEPRRLTERNPVLPQDVRFQVEVSPSETGHVYVLTEPANGAGPLVMLFPTPNANSDSSLVTSGTSLQIPRNLARIRGNGRA